jgi:hypothetical protein
MRGVKSYGSRLVFAISVTFFLGSTPILSLADGTSKRELTQLQQQLDAMGKAGGGTLHLPAGEIDLSGCSDWTSNYQGVDGNDPFMVGLLIPSHVWVVGAGMGKTIFRYKRLPGDPICSLFANVDRVSGNSDIKLSDLSIVADDQTGGVAGSLNSAYNAPLYMNKVTGFQMERVRIEGNTDRQVNLMDVNGSNIHSCTFAVNSTSYGYGDSSIGIDRSTAFLPRTPRIRIENNFFAEIGRYPTFSIIVNTANDVLIANNMFDLQTFRPGIVGGNAIEVGPNVDAEAPARIVVKANTVLGGEVWPFWATDSKITSNLVVNGSIGVQAADVTTTTCLSNVSITHNIVQFGSIQAKAVTAGTLTNLVISDNELSDSGVQVQGNLVGAVVLRNSIRNSPEDGIDCYGCATIAYNRVENAGQSDPWNSASIAINVGPIFGTSFWVDQAEHNTVVDNQGSYSNGRICAVSKENTSQCANAPGQFVILAGGSWNPLWTNRTLYVNGAALLIRRFISNNELELEEPASIPQGSLYRLYHTTAFAFQLYANINSFSFNEGNARQGWRGAAIIQQNADGVITVNDSQSNQFSPYSCWNCTYSY